MQKTLEICRIISHGKTYGLFDFLKDKNENFTE